MNSLADLLARKKRAETRLRILEDLLKNIRSTKEKLVVDCYIDVHRTTLEELLEVAAAVVMKEEELRLLSEPQRVDPEPAAKPALIPQTRTGSAIIAPATAPASSGLFNVKDDKELQVNSEVVEINSHSISGLCGSCGQRMYKRGRAAPAGSESLLQATAIKCAACAGC